jgi:hypothetical protein
MTLCHITLKKLESEVCSKLHDFGSIKIVFGWHMAYGTNVDPHLKSSEDFLGQVIEWEHNLRGREPWTRGRVNTSGQGFTVFICWSDIHILNFRSKLLSGYERSDLCVDY